MVSPERVEAYHVKYNCWIMILICKHAHVLKLVFSVGSVKMGQSHWRTRQLFLGCFQCLKLI